MSFTDQPQQILPEQHLMLEQPMIRVPYEQLRMAFKSAQRHAERDVSAVLPVIDDIKRGNADDHKIMSVIQRLEKLKSKILSVKNEQLELLDTSKKRLRGLNKISSFRTLGSSGYHQWESERLDRTLVDYLLRNGIIDIAKEFANIKGVTEFADVQLYESSSKIRQSLLRRSCEECLAWCAEHRMYLRKSKSSLELQLRLQEYIELIRARRLRAAIAYAQKHLASYIELNANIVLNAAALLAYSPSSPPHLYEHYYSSARWEMLADMFIKTHHELYSIPETPLLFSALAAGLSALKLPACYRKTPTPTATNGGKLQGNLVGGNNFLLCPVCEPRLNQIAKEVPFAHALRSSIIDPLRGTKLGGNNEPTVLPNGRVYGSESLSAWNDKAGTPPDRVRDPITGEDFPSSGVRKVYVL